MPRLEDDRAGERDALALAAAERGHRAPRRALEPDERERGARPSRRRSARASLRMRSGNPMLSATVMCGNSA